MCRPPTLLAVLLATPLVVPPSASGECVGGGGCEEPCPAEDSCYSDAECGPGRACDLSACIPSFCECVSSAWNCTADCAGQCTGTYYEDCAVEIERIDLHQPNVVEVCVSNDSWFSSRTVDIGIDLEGPGCRWNRQHRLILRPRETRCVYISAPSPCCFDFGQWCARVELWDESVLCDAQQVCRDFGDECHARIVHVGLYQPNMVEVCVRNESDCAKTYEVVLDVDGPACRWHTQLQWMLGSGELRCEYIPASPCYFDFGRWCVRVELWVQSLLCDVRQECREFCSEPPPPPMNISASDGDFCEGILVTWPHVPYAEYYEVFLNPWFWGDCDTFLARTHSNHYWDTECEPDDWCYYSVQAINLCSRSSCSDVDGGYRASMFADWEPDCDADLDDYAVFESCMSGPAPDSELAAGCQVFNSDHDGDVDLTDVGAFQRAFTGP